MIGNNVEITGCCNVSGSNVIDDDVWIGRDVTIMVGRHISKGTIVAANSVVTKDFPEYSIIGGNPAKLIRSGLDKNS